MFFWNAKVSAGFTSLYSAKASKNVGHLLSHQTLPDRIRSEPRLTQSPLLSSGPKLSEVYCGQFRRGLGYPAE